MKTPGPTCQRIAAIIAQRHPEARVGIPLVNAVRGNLYGIATGLTIGLLIGLTIGAIW